MRFSPYEMTEYTLLTKTTRCSPVQVKADSVSEGEWNLLWASIPEFDDFLNLRRDDFKEFNRLVRIFPYSRLLRVRGIYHRYPEIHKALREGTPQQVDASLSDMSVFYPDVRATIENPITLKSRLAMAQSLIDVKEASVICRNILTVDFKARRRA